ncbi:MAG: LacI family DNA-binding transcriptional regulator [Solirubrobacteraceae bacterium]
MDSERNAGVSEWRTGAQRRPRAAVMADVGRLAGVSHQTVSRVINDSAHVRAATRARVLAAMAELGYEPNPIARALVTGRTRTIGVVSFDTTLYGPASTLCGIERAAHEAGYFIVVASLKALDRASVADGIDRLRRHGVEGILVIAPLRDAVDALLHAHADVPLVAVEAGPDRDVPVVAVDQAAGARAATEHLLGLGHANVFHVAGPFEFLESEQRLTAWRTTLEQAGRSPRPPLTGDWSAASGYEIGLALSEDESVTAIFVANDHMALGVLHAMHERRRAVPGEVSVVGFDDIPEAPYFTPPLTTVCQDFDELGSRGVGVLLGRLDGGDGLSARPLVAPRLIVRGSTAPPPARGARGAAGAKRRH